MTVIIHTTLTSVDSAHWITEGRLPTIISTLKQSIAECWGDWGIPTQNPENNNKVKQRIGHTIKASIRTTSKNHIVKFHKKLCIQFQDVAIGVGVVGDLAELFMTLWNKILQ